MKHQTLLFLIRDGKEVLLAMKKRGFGEGKLNGVGGKVEEGETAEDAIIRETREEIGVSVRKEDLQHRGEIEFRFPGEDGMHIRVEVFSATLWQGEPQETEEMKPQWYAFEAIPYEAMWVDDKYWLPLLLDGKDVAASFNFNEDGSEILSQDVRSRG